jgi:hypothetical protein
MQPLAGNRAVDVLSKRGIPAGDRLGQRELPRFFTRTSDIQRLAQSLPYAGPFLSYLNYIHQAARLVRSGLSTIQKSLLDAIFGSSLPPPSSG